MKRREFSLAAAGVAAGLPMVVRAQAKVPEDGREYRTLEKRVGVEAPAGKIEVVDFFWYSCPHCNAFEPTLRAWSQRLPADVTLRRVPAAFRDDMVPQQRFFYALEALGKLDELHGKVFDAIHKQGLPLTRQQPIVDWVAKQGIDPQKFTELYNSFAVSAKARRATELQDQYGIDGVPAMGVAGRYYTDGTLTAGNVRMLQVVDYLIGETRKSR
jgi:thiol:disulfide interchange protein DsbA